MFFKKINPILEKITIEAHENIKQLFLESKEYQYQYKVNKIKPELIQKLQKNDPLHAIRISQHEYKFFAGWFWLPACQFNNVNRIRIHVYSGIDKEELKRQSYLYVLNKQLGSFHRRSNLAQLSNYIENMPHHITKEFFGSGSSSGNIIVQFLSNETRSALRNQINQLLLAPSQPPESISIIDVLTRRDHNVD